MFKKSLNDLELEKIRNLGWQKFILISLIISLICYFFPLTSKNVSYQNPSNVSSQSMQKMAVFSVNDPFFQLDCIETPISSTTNIFPILEDGRIMIPLTSLVSFIEAKMEYENLSSNIVVIKDNIRITFKSGSDSVTVENKKDGSSKVINVKVAPLFQNYTILIDPYEFKDYFAIDIQESNNKLVILRNYKSKTILLKTKYNSYLNPSKYNASHSVYHDQDQTLMLEFDTEYDTKVCYDDLKDNSKVDLIKIVGSMSYTHNTLSWDTQQTGVTEYLNYITQNFDLTKEVKAAVIDSGVNENHPDLAGRLTNERYNFVNDNNDTTDKYGHGTMVAGIIANNTSMNVKIMPIKVTDLDGRGNSNDVARGIEFAVRNGADIINLSLSIDSTHSKSVETAIEFATNNNVAVVIAAGNSGIDASSLCPMHVPNTIVVGAVDQNGNRASFSNYGNVVTVSAPGTQILAPYLNNDYRIVDGTSLAAPCATAEIAMIRSLNPDINLTNITHLVKLATNRTHTDKYIGCGVINMSKLINYGSFRDYNASNAA